MKYCAICGIVKLNHQHTNFRKNKNVYNKENGVDHGCTPYGVANYLLPNYTTTPNGQEIYLRLKCYVQMSPHRPIRGSLAASLLQWGLLEVLSYQDIAVLH
jgi:hypothetical protein